MFVAVSESEMRSFLTDANKLSNEIVVPVLDPSASEAVSPSSTPISPMFEFCRRTNTNGAISDRKPWSRSY